MATIFKSNGVDLDSIFEPRGNLAPVPDVVYSSNGQNLSDRYAPAGSGSPVGTPTIFSSGGQNLADIFAAIGSIAGWPDPAPYEGGFISAALSLNNAPATARITFQFNTDGTFQWTKFFENNGVPSTEVFGPFTILDPNLNATEVELQAVQTSGPTADRNDLLAFSDLSVARVIDHTVEVLAGPGGDTAVLTFDITIREIATPANSDTSTATISLDATSEP